MLRKLYLIGNEYYVVYYSVSGALWAMEIVEGKDFLLQLDGRKYLEYGKTTSLL